MRYDLEMLEKILYYDAEDAPSLVESSEIQPTVFPDDMLAENQEDRAINLLLVDGTKDELIFKALKKRLLDTQVSYEVTELDRYTGITYKR